MESRMPLEPYQDPYHQSTTLQCSNSQTSHARQLNSTMIRPRNVLKATLLIWIRSVPNQSCGHLNSPDSPLRDLVTGGMTGEGVNVHENESVRCKPMHASFWQHHPHSRYVDHASDGMIYCVPETTHNVLDGGSLLH